MPAGARCSCSTVIAPDCSRASAGLCNGTEVPVTEEDDVTAQITTGDINRGSYPHFLLKEITESPASFRKTFAAGSSRSTVGES